jgi:hypothetical protein
VVDRHATPRLLAVAVATPCLMNRRTTSRRLGPERRRERIVRLARAKKEAAQGRAFGRGGGSARGRRWLGSIIPACRRDWTWGIRRVTSSPAPSFQVSASRGAPPSLSCPLSSSASSYSCRLLAVQSFGPLLPRAALLNIQVFTVVHAARISENGRVILS